MLIVLSGLPGVGKTTVGRLVARRMGAALLRIDSIEQALRAHAGAPPTGAEGYRVAYRIAADNLLLGLPVVADCVNACELSRVAWRKVAEEGGCRHVFVQLVCSDSHEHRRRVEHRVADLPGHVLPTWAAVERLEFASPPPDAVVIDTAFVRPEEAAHEVIRRSTA